MKRVLATLALAAMGATFQASAAPPKIATITYAGYLGAPMNLTEQVAIDQGLFAKHGLDVKFVGIGSGQQMVSALMGGTAQFGALTTSATAPLMNQGQCFQFLTASARSYYNLIARPDLPLPKAASGFPSNLVDLKGKRIGINARGTAMEFMMDALLKEAGVKPSEVTYIATGGSATGVAAFRNRQVDVLMDFPIAEQLLQPGEYQNVARLMEIEKGNPIHNLSMAFSGASCDYVKKNPEVVAAFCSAIGEAFKYVNNPANKDAVVGAVQKMMSIDKPMAESFWKQYNSSWPTAKIDEATWKQQTVLLPAGSQLRPYSEAVPSACQAKL